MIQIKNMRITLRKDLRTIAENLNFTLNKGDKAVIIGEEGNGKSTLLKACYDKGLVEEYADVDGCIISNGAKAGYLKQELDSAEKALSIEAYFARVDGFYDIDAWELSEIARKLGLPGEIFFSEQIVGTLSGGERVKLQLARLLAEKPDYYLLDEPSNDIDLYTLEWLERFINESHIPVLFISHDETLVENTADTIIHMELVRRKTTPRITVSKLGYKAYVKNRQLAIERQTQQARKEKEEYDSKLERYRRIRQSVDSAQTNIAYADRDYVGGRLRKKMNTVKALGRRFEKEHADMVQLPDLEEQIFMRFDDEIRVPNGKTVLDLSLDGLTVGGRTLATGIKLRVTGAQKVCVVGRNGAGKTTLLRIIANELLARGDIRAAYMPQNYADTLDHSLTPVEFLAPSGITRDVSRAMTYLGSMKYTTDEMSHRISELSGGQQAKLLLSKMILDGADVLILDEPTRNISPLSNPVLRGVLKSFGGAVISTSHDRKYINEVCDTVYELTETGLRHYGR